VLLISFSTCPVGLPHTA